MPARGRRSAKPFTRRRSAAAFRLRPPVPRMNLSPNRGREDGAAVRPGPPGVVRLRPLLAGRQDLPGYGYGCPFRRSVAHPAFRSPFRRLRRCSFFGGLLLKAFFGGPSRRLRRCSFFGGLLPKAFFGGPSRRHGLPTPFCRRSFFGGPSLRGGAAFFCARRNGPLCPPPLVSAPSRLCPLSSLPPLRSAPSRLCPLSALSPLRSVPSPLCPLSAPSPLRSVPSPLRPLSAPSRSRPVPVPVPSFGGAPLRRFFSVRGLKNRKNCLDL